MYNIVHKYILVYMDNGYSTYMVAGIGGAASLCVRIYSGRFISEEYIILNLIHFVRSWPYVITKHGQLLATISSLAGQG